MLNFQHMVDIIIIIIIIIIIKQLITRHNVNSSWHYIADMAR